MDSIFTEEKKINHQSMKKKKKMIMKKKKKGHNHEFVYNFVVYALTAFLSCLFYLYLFCFPYSMSHFFFDFSFLLNSKFVFLLGNIIVIVLFIGESRNNKLGSSLGLRSSSSPADKIYDEYMEIKRRTLIRQQTMDDEHKKISQKVNDEDHKDEVRNNINYIIRRNCSVNNIIDYQKKKMIMTMEGDRDRGLIRRPRSTVVEHKDKKKEEDDKTLIIIHENDQNNVMSLDEEKISKETSLWANCGSMTRPKSLGRLDDMHDEISNHDNGDGCDHHDEDDVVSNKKNMKIKSREEKRKEMEKSMEELNRRVEDFIARVNRQRMLESTMD